MQIKVKIEKIIHNGFGLARLNNKAVFVSNVLPEEMVGIQIIEEKKNYAYARPLEIIEPSPKRIVPVCPYYPLCGGCHFMHTPYEEQIRFKEEVLHSFLDKVVPEELEKFIISRHALNYKTSATFVVKNKKLNYYQRQSKNLIVVEYCYLLDQQMNQFLKNLVIPDTVSQLKMKMDNQGRISSNFFSKNNKNNRIEYLIDEIKVVYDHRTFFQSNKYLLPAWLEIIKKEAEKFSLRRVLDLFCGTGIISLYLANKTEVRRISGIELDNTAINYAKQNREMNKLFQTNFIAGKAEKVLRNYEQVSLIIMDPPRTGAGKEVIAAAAKLKPEGIIYSSCEISTFIQDAVYLKEYGYELKKLIPLDMFPQTFHFEVVGVFTR